MNNNDRDQDISTTFETLGWYEEVLDLSGRTIGTRNVKRQQGRACGHSGMQEVTLTDPVTLQRGHKTYVLQASAAKPVKVLTILNIKCGRMLDQSE
jgi:hypothetical protein